MGHDTFKIRIVKYSMFVESVFPGIVGDLTLL